jgi:hypothetical protein
MAALVGESRRGHALALLVISVATFALVFSAPARAWGTAQSVPGDSSGPPYVFTGPDGGMHILADVSGIEEWFDFTSGGALGAGQKLPGPGGPVNEVAWTPDGRAVVQWGDELAVRATNGTWGPAYAHAISVAPGGMAVDNNEAFLLQDATSSIQQLQIASNGAITAGSSTSLAQIGDTEASCGGAIALAPNGSSGIAIYSVGHQVRQATLTSTNSWTVSNGSTVTSGNALFCPTGGSASGRLVVVWGEEDGTAPYYNEPAPETALVYDATWVPGSALQIATLTQRTTATGQINLGQIWGASAGADGSLAAWGGTAACDAANTPFGNGELVVGSAAASGLTGGETEVLPAIPATGTDTPRTGAGAGGAQIGAVSVFGGRGMVAASQSSAGSPGSPDCTGVNGSTLFEVAAAAGAAPDATLRASPSGSGGDLLVSSAVDGKGDAVVTAESFAISGSGYVMYINGTPGPGSSSGGKPPPKPPPKGNPNPGSGKKASAKLTKASINSKHHTARFAFKATGATSFQCALIRLPAGKKHKQAPTPHFSSCKSPKTYKHLKNAKYKFELRALDAAGKGPVASKSFTIG